MLWRLGEGSFRLQELVNDHTVPLDSILFMIVLSKNIMIG